MPGNMLIPPLCEQLIGPCAVHQALREGEAVSLDASVWHHVHHSTHLATPSQLAASEGKRHTCVSCLSLRQYVCTSKGHREGVARSICKLQRWNSLIVTYDFYIYDVSLNPLKTGCNFGAGGFWEYSRNSGYMRGN